MPRKRGPAPQATVIKLAAGNPGKRKINKNEPQPKLAASQPPPEWLSDYAKEKWNELVPELVRLDLLSVVDFGALEMACDAYGIWRMFRDELGHQPFRFTYQTDKGNELVKPDYQIMNQACQNYRAFISEFGLSPSARTRLTTPNNGKQNPELNQYDRFFKQG